MTTDPWAETSARASSRPSGSRRGPGPRTRPAASRTISSRTTPTGLREPVGPRTQARHEARMRAVYRRRRVTAAVLLFISLWVLASGCRAMLGLLDGGDAQAEEHSSETGDTVGVVARGPAEEAACPSDDELYGATDEPVPADLRATVDELLADPLVAGRQVSVSVWVDGWGEVASNQPDLALKPASNQKLLVAVGALELLDPEARLTTELRAGAPVEGGTIAGDLVLVAGGDPTLWDVGEHSIYQMAVELRDLGVTHVTGGLVIDESRYDDVRTAPGWTPQQIPGDAAPITAFTVAANRLGDTPAYLADPALGNGEVLRQYLADVGITVDGGVSYADPEAAEAAESLVSVSSPTIAQLVDNMLRNSDNTAAELLVKEIDLAAGGAGTTAGGLQASRAVVEGWCLSLAGGDDDGSGLSYANTRSAREWRQLLQLAQAQDWWPLLYEGLPVAGDADGTLAGRLTGDATAGNLRAKTGTINVARGLTGVFTTAGGRPATFSVIINDEADPAAAVGPTDLLLEAIAAHPG
jgi:D-alanyl-D-alanine carboxypeptidase/D-alanyl-D-alanine-endopeptidase (penicillin-binding protein 4)